MQENIDYVGDIFYEIELAEKFDLIEDEDIQTITVSCGHLTWVCC